MAGKLGKFVRAHRLQLHLSQAAIAKLVGIGQRQFSNIEISVHCRFTPERIKALAQALQCSFSKLKTLAPKNQEKAPATALGKFILEQRKRLGLSRQELAEKLQVRDKYIRWLEMGGSKSRKIIYKTAQRLAEALKLEPTAFSNFVVSPNTKETKSGLGKLVRARRLELCISQRQLAKKIGKTCQTVSYIEHGALPLNSNGPMLTKLAEALELDLAALEALKPKRQAKKFNAKPNTLAAFFVNRRMALGLTRVEVKRRTGLSINAVFKVERGIYRPSQETIAKICTALDCKLPPLYLR